MEQGSILTSLLPLIVLFAIFYFLVIRPQQKQARAHQKMISELSKGDKFITNGGLICEVVKPEVDFIKVKINDEGVLAKISKKFIAEKFEPAQNAAENAAKIAAKAENSASDKARKKS